MSTARFTAAVEAFRAWDVAIDAYLVDSTDQPSKDEQATHAAFEQAFTSLCNERGVYRGVPACRLSENLLWDQVAAVATEVQA